MTKLKSTIRILNTLKILVVIFASMFVVNAVSAQKIIDEPYDLGITPTKSGMVLKSAFGDISNLLLLNKNQELLGALLTRKFDTPEFPYVIGLLDSNGKYCVRHRTGHSTLFMINYDTKMAIYEDGRVAIGNVKKDSPMIQKIGGATSTDDADISADEYKLIVETGILTEKVKVAGLNTTDWADYVFEDNYEILPINELENYVKENKHLPNVPSAKEVAANGLDLAKTDATLLEKIEESYLYIIELNKKFEALEAQNNQLKADLKILQTLQN